MWRWLAILLGLGATVSAIIAVAVNYNYIPASLVGNFTATEWGFFAALFIAGAVAIEVMSNRHKISYS